MKRWAKFTCLMLALLLVFTALPTFLAVPATAAEAGPEEEPPKDIVLLLDCSESLGFNDPKNLRLEACKSFIDTLPTENARISVIAFGYEGDPFPYTTDEVILPDDTVLVHEIVPLGDMGTAADKEEYKRIMADTLNSKKGTMTPAGHALVAAIEVLERNYSANGNACIILVSDGVNEPRTQIQDDKLVGIASTRAGEHDWPIYSVQLNYNNSDDEQAAKANALLDTISANSGDHEVGRVSCETPDGVSAAFEQIFCDFYGLDFEPPVAVTIPLDGPGEHTFTVPELTSELTINVYGENIEKVDLINLKQNSSSTYSKSVEEAHRIVVVEEYYYSIKMLVPQAGEWKVRIYGNAEATVLVSTNPLQEMGLKMMATPSSDSEYLTKDDTIRVSAVFEYKGVRAASTKFYENNHATLMVYPYGRTPMEYEMQATEDGYYLDLNVRDIDTGAFELQVALDHNMFRNGRKTSNVESFKMENLPIEVILNDPITLNGYVNNVFERIDLSTVFGNPDNDEVTYELICDDREVKFGYEVSEDYMTIQTGLAPGTYEMSITAIDEDMSKPVVYDKLTLVVENRDPVVIAMPSQELWLDYYSFQELGMLDLELDLNSHFSDPDGMPLSYSVAVSQENVVQMQLEGSVLKAAPAMEESVTVTVTASDGISEVTGTFEIEVVSGKGIFWAENWIWFALAAGALVLIIIIIVSISKLTRAKGKWSVSFEENGYLEDIGQLNLNTLPVCRKQKVFKLKDMIMQIGNFASNNSDVITHIPSYFGNPGAAKLEVKGVPFGSGFVLNKIPEGEAVQVDYNGRTVRKSVRVSGGTLRVVLTVQTPYGGEDKLVITMRSN